MQATDTVSFFGGIPYGKAPVDELRWQAPVAYGEWGRDHPWDGTSFGTRCAQLITITPHDTPAGEDCLFLNVFVKASAVSGNDAAGIPPGTSARQHDRIRSQRDSTNGRAPALERACSRVPPRENDADVHRTPPRGLGVPHQCSRADYRLLMGGGGGILNRHAHLLLLMSGFRACARTHNLYVYRCTAHGRRSYTRARQAPYQHINPGPGQDASASVAAGDGVDPRWCVHDRGVKRVHW